MLQLRQSQDGAPSDFSHFFVGTPKPGQVAASFKKNRPLAQAGQALSAVKNKVFPGSVSGLKNRSENSAGRGQILSIVQVNSHSIDQKNGEIWTVQADFQPISFKSDRLLAFSPAF